MRPAPIERFVPLLVDVWSDACPHIEIDESLQRVAPQLQLRLPVDLVLVRRLDERRHSVETVA